ncbi:CSEP0296 putative effector protein [Blumeria hordei DH14]|uniref:CSEP0296 putative effector protein n=1 Tax=Blumeria graminis f. sp. hordei (strain DH14) TaxID=546991 RepID=N1J5J7_BLUG1|nr:CSEP0296 putative effector protein [Blumeria hordei DH14]
MRSYAHAYTLYALLFLTLICSSFARSAPSSSIFGFNKRDCKPNHVGYQCLSSKVNIRDIKSTMKSACDKLKQRNNKKGFVLFFINLYKPSVSSKPFPETEKFGFPKDAQMDAVRESVLCELFHSLLSVCFSSPRSLLDKLKVVDFSIFPIISNISVLTDIQRMHGIIYYSRWNSSTNLTAISHAK